MTKEELLQKEIARILQEHPEDPVAALREKRKRAIIAWESAVSQHALKPVRA